MIAHFNAEPSRDGLPTCPISQVSDTPPISESLMDGGLAVRYGDIDALRDALVRLLSDAALRQRLAAQGKAAVLEYCHPDRVVEQYQHIYELAYAMTKPDTKLVQSARPPSDADGKVGAA